MGGKKGIFSTFGSISSWFFGVILLLYVFFFLFISVLSSILFLIGAIIILPPSRKVLEEKIKFSFSWWQLVLVFLVSCLLAPTLGAIFMDSDSSTNTHSNELEQNIGGDSSSTEVAVQEVLECNSSDDCADGETCIVGNKCCKQECANNRCEGYMNIGCNIIEGCGTLNPPALEIGYCGVECLNDNQCSKGERCNSNNYTCEQYTLDDTVVVGGTFEWSLKHVGKTKTVGPEYFQETANGEFYVLYATVTNIGKSPQSFSPTFIRLVDSEDRIYQPEQFLFIEDALSWDTINPGVTARGTIYFDVPTNFRPVGVQLSSNLYEDSLKSIFLYI